ncbi:hypothetical protein MBLNU230_g0549t1 [Neophaeotheca triangularis]
MASSSNEQSYSQGQGHEYLPLENIARTDYSPHNDDRRFSFDVSDRDFSSLSPINDRNRASISDQEDTDTLPTEPKQPKLQGAYDHHVDDEASARPRTPARFSLRDWQWEFVAAVFSLACVVAVIVLLIRFQDKALSSWEAPYDMKMNTLVALLSTLSRTALIIPVASCISQLKWIHLMHSPRPLREIQTFDDASRGPWGSLGLIWRLHFRTKLAAWGAIITIVSLAMGPLAQQLVSYPSRKLYEPLGAIVYRSQTYDSGVKRSTSGIGLRFQDTFMDPGMQGAILNGLYNLSSPIPFQCRTANCQWSVFTTLAVASVCRNVTSEVVTVCPEKTVLCNHTTPSGHELANVRGARNVLGEWITSIRAESVYPLGLLPNSSLVTFALAKLSSPFTYDAPGVIECDVRWVVRVMRDTSVRNGIFNAGVSKDFELSPIPIPRDVEPEDNWQYLEPADTRSNLDAHLLLVNASLENRTFSVIPIDWYRTRSFLVELFGAPIGRGDYGWRLFNSTDLMGTIANITNSMTYQLGQSKSAEIVQGETIDNEQWINVHWPWISLPLAQVTMGIAFLLITLVHPKRAGVLA